MTAALLDDLTGILDDAAADDDLDRDIARRIVAQLLDDNPETRATIAARHDTHDSVVQYRARRLLKLLRSHLDLARTP